MSDERERDGDPAGAPAGAQAPWSAPGRVPAPSVPAVSRPGTGPFGAPGDAAPPAPRGPAGAPPAPFAAGARERERVFAGPGYTSAGLRNDGFAVGAMVLGILGIVVPGVCLVAVALGHVSLHRLTTSYSGGRGLAVAGLVLGYAGLVIWVCVLLLYLALRTFS